MPDNSTQQVITHPNHPKTNFLGRRIRIFLGGLVTVLLLGAFTLSAFWRHISELEADEQYRLIAQVGAMFGEAVCLFLLYEYAFDKSIRVRREALLGTFFLSLVLIGHAAVLRGRQSIEHRQTATENRLKTELTDMSKQQMDGVQGAQAGELNPRTRRAVETAAATSRTTLGTNAQNQLADTIKNREASISSQSWMPDWYVNGGMYLVIFAVASLVLTRITWLHINTTKEDLDINYDNIPDYLQQGQGYGELQPAGGYLPAGSNGFPDQSEPLRGNERRRWWAPWRRQ